MGTSQFIFDKTKFRQPQILDMRPPQININSNEWIRGCVACQKSNINKHTGCKIVVSSKFMLAHYVGFPGKENSQMSRLQNTCVLLNARISKQDKYCVCATREFMNVCKIPIDKSLI